MKPECAGTDLDAGFAVAQAHANQTGAVHIVWIADGQAWCDRATKRDMAHTSLRSEVGELVEPQGRYLHRVVV